MGKRKELINPSGTEHIYKSMQFSQAVRAGNTIYVSGQVGGEENFVPGAGIEEQANLLTQKRSSYSLNKIHAFWLVFRCGGRRRSDREFFAAIT